MLGRLIKMEASYSKEGGGLKSSSAIIMEIIRNVFLLADSTEKFRVLRKKEFKFWRKHW